MGYKFDSFNDMQRAWDAHRSQVERAACGKDGRAASAMPMARRHGGWSNARMVAASAAMLAAAVALQGLAASRPAALSHGVVGARHAVAVADEITGVQ